MEGGRSWNNEDPRRRDNLHTKFLFRAINNNKDAIWPVPFAFFTSVNNYLSAEAGSSLPLLAPNELSAFLP